MESLEPNEKSRYLRRAGARTLGMTLSGHRAGGAMGQAGGLAPGSHEAGDNKKTTF